MRQKKKQKLLKRQDGRTRSPQCLSPRPGLPEKQFFAACSHRNTISPKLPVDPGLTQKFLHPYERTSRFVGELIQQKL